MDFQDMDMGLAISLTALLVSSLAGIIGMWVERDDDRPIKIFAALVVLCLLSTAVSMWQAIDDANEAAKQEEAMANVLQKLDFIMQQSGVDVPAINDLVKSELADASRNNPSLVRKVARRVADSGGDPNAVLGSYLAADQMNRMQRSGAIQPNSEGAAAAVRKPLQFGGGPTQVRIDGTSRPLEAVKTAAIAPPPVAAPAPPEVPSAAPEPPATTAQVPPAVTPKAPSAKPSTPASALPSDKDIYDEAEADLRRK